MISGIDNSVDKKAGRTFLIWNGKTVEEPGIIAVTTKRTIKTRTRTPLGSRVEQTKVTGVSNDGTLTVDLHATSIFNDLIDEYELTGKQPKFDFQIINEDPSTTIGKRVVRYFECLLKADVNLNMLEHSSEDAATSEIGFAFRDKQVLQDYRK